MTRIRWIFAGFIAAISLGVVAVTTGGFPSRPTFQALGVGPGTLPGGTGNIGLSGGIGVNAAVPGSGSIAMAGGLGVNVSAPAAGTIQTASGIGIGAAPSANGGLIVAAPSSGTAVTVNGVSGSPVAQFVGASSAGGTLQLKDGNAGNQLWNLSSGGTSTGLFSLRDATRGVDVISANTTGNVTVAAPSSGTALTINGVASTAGIAVSSSELPAITLTASPVTLSMRAYSAGTAGLVGTTSNHGLNLRTNDIDRITVAAAGNIVVNAPSSGVAVTVNGVSGSATANISNFGIGTNVGLNGSADNLYTNGNAAFAFGTTGTGALNIYTNNTLRFTLSNAGGLFAAGATGGDQGINTINASGLFVNGTAVSTSTTSTQTGTYTGCTTSPTTSVVVSKNSSLVTATFVTGTTCTSNATTFSITGALTAATQPARTQVVPVNAMDNGVGVIACAQVNPASNTVSLFNGVGCGAWTASGSKGLNSNGVTFTYQLN